MRLVTVLLVLFANSVFAQHKKTYPYLNTEISFKDSLLRYMVNVPHEVHDSCIRGTVVISFLVKTDGTIDSLLTRHKVHPLIDMQAYNMLFNTNGKWAPGTIDGKPVAMRRERSFQFIIPDLHKFNRRYIPNDPLLAKWFKRCMDGDDHYKTGLSLYKNKQYEEAWKAFDRANRTDLTHLDAIDMLRRTGDIIGKPCEICSKLELLEEYSDREIKRIRDKYCTKDFKAISDPATGGNTVYQYLPQMPRPASSPDEFLNQNIRYPEKARQDCKQGTVLTRFIVKKDGSVDSVKISYSVDAELDAEAIRVVSLMKNFWQPGLLEGVPASVYYTLAVKFSLDNPECHDDKWYLAEGEKLYEADKTEEAFAHFRQAFTMNRTNFKAGYDYAAASLSLGKTDEACSAIKYLIENNYTPAKALADQFCK